MTQEPVAERPGPQPPAEALAVLLKAYELDRTDDIHSGYAFLTTLTVSIGLISLIGFALINADDESLPGWMIAFLPLVPVPFAALAALYAHLAQVRGVLVDHYESELRRRYPQNAADGVPVPSGHSILGQIWVGAYGRTVLALVAGPLITMNGAVVVESYRIAHRTEPELAVASLVVAIAAAVALTCLLVVAQWPERVVRGRAGRG